MDRYHSIHGLFWANRYPSYFLLLGRSLDFCSLKAARIGISQLLGQRNF